jgi:outer membrane protein assembly factor BamB
LEGSKEGVGYLLRNDDLGGPGGQLFDHLICDTGIWGGTAIVDSRIFFACGDGVVAIDVENERFDVAWGSEHFHAASPIVTGDVVWSVDMDEGRLLALSADDGEELHSVKIGTLPTQFITPSASNGVLYVAADRRVIAFK